MVGKSFFPNLFAQFVINMVAGNGKQPAFKISNIGQLGPVLPYFYKYILHHFFGNGCRLGKRKSHLLYIWSRYLSNSWRKALASSLATCSSRSELYKEETGNAVVYQLKLIQ